MDCPDCGIEMQRGFIPDVGLGYYQPANWHPGEPEIEKSFGMKLGRGTHYDSKQAVPITSYRCPACGLLRSYAHIAGDGKA